MLVPCEYFLYKDIGALCRITQCQLGFMSKAGSGSELSFPSVTFQIGYKPNITKALLAPSFPHKFIWGCRDLESKNSILRIRSCGVLAFDPMETITFCAEEAVASDIEYLVSTVLPYRFSTA